MHWIWYLPDKNQERVKILNLLQELIQLQIYVNYALPFGQSSQINRMNYSLNKLFNAFRMWRMMNCIFFVIDLNESSTEEDMKKAYCSLARQFLL